MPYIPEWDQYAVPLVLHGVPIKAIKLIALIWLIVLTNVNDVYRGAGADPGRYALPSSAYSQRVPSCPGRSS